MDAHEYVAQLVVLRDKNVFPEASRTHFSDNIKPKLSADVKKVTAFVKKVRQFTGESSKLLTDQLSVLNIKMFVSEIAQSVGPAIWEGKMKLADVPPFVTFLSTIHHSYDVTTFSQESLQSFQQGFAIQALMKELSTPLVETQAAKDAAAASSKADPAAAAAAVVDIAKLRVGVRAMCEFWVTGWIPSTKFFNNFVGKIVSTLDSDPKARVTPNAMSLVLLILKSIGVELIGSKYQGVGKGRFTFSEKKVDGSHIVVIEEPATEDERDVLRQDPSVYSKLKAKDSEQDDLYDRLCKLADHCLRYTGKIKRQVDTKWRTMTEQAELHGQLSQEKKDAFEAVQAETERIITLCENFTSAIGYPESPARLELHLLAKTEGGNVVVLGSATQDFFSVKNAESINCYDSSKEREFYEEFPDLMDIISSSCPTLQASSLISASVPVERTVDTKKDEDDDMEGVYVSGGDQKAKKARMSVADDEDEPIIIHRVLEGCKSQEAVGFSELTLMLENLSQLASAVSADAWVAKFILYAIRFFADSAVVVADAQTYFALCRRRVVKHLRIAFNCGTQSLPYVARCVAVLCGVGDDNLIFAPAGSTTLGEFIASKIEGELQHAIRAKTQTNGMRKQKATRYLCELVKYRTCGPIRAIRVLQTGLTELEDNPHGVEIVVSLVEVVGPFLCRLQVTKSRIVECVQSLADLLKKTAFLSESAVDTIRSAIAFYHRAVERGSSDGDELQRRCIPGYEFLFGVAGESPETALERFLRHLMFTFVVSEETAEVASFKLRRVPWVDAQLPAGEMKYQSKAPPTPSEIAIKVLRSVKDVKWGSIPYFCMAIAHLRSRDGLKMIVDTVCASAFEDVSHDLEVSSWSSGALLYAVCMTVEKNIQQAQLSEKKRNAAPIEAEDTANIGSSALRHLQSAEKKELESQTSNSNGPLIKQSLLGALSTAKFQAPGARSNHETTIDVAFLSEMYNWNVVGSSAITTQLAKILLYFPSYPGSSQAKATVKQMVRKEIAGKIPSSVSTYASEVIVHFSSTSLPSEFTRLRLACTAISGLVPYVFPVQDLYRSATTPAAAREAHTAMLKAKSVFVLCVRVFLAHLYVLVHTRAAPLPSELQYELADMLQMCLAHLSSEIGELTFSQVVGSPWAVQATSFEGRASHSTMTAPTPVVVPTSNKTSASNPSNTNTTAGRLSDENIQLFKDKMSSQIKKRLFKNFSDKEWKAKTSSKREEIRGRVRKEILLEGGPTTYKGRDRAEIAAALLDGKSSATLRAESSTASVPQYYFPPTLACALAHLDRVLLLDSSTSSDKYAVTPEEAAAYDGRILPPTTSHSDLEGLSGLVSLMKQLVLEDPQCVSPILHPSKYKNNSNQQGGSAAQPIPAEEEEEEVVVVAMPSTDSCSSSSDEEEDEGSSMSTSDEEGSSQSNEEDDESDDDASVSSDDDDDDMDDDEEEDEDESSTYSDSSNSSDHGPAMGPGAFRIKMGASARSSRDRAGQSEEANELDRMMNAMIMESTSKAMGQQRGRDTTAEMRLSGAFYSGAIKKVKLDGPPSSSSTPTSALSRLSASSPSSSTADPPKPATPDFSSFAFLKRGGKKAVATSLTVPSNTEFVARVERNITQSEKERVERHMNTMQLYRQQELDAKMEHLARGREMDIREEEERLVADQRAREHRQLQKRENQNLEKKRADTRKVEGDIDDKVTKDERIGSIRFRK